MVIEMLTYGQGLLFGVAYIAPIGVQNLYTINTALAQPRGRALRAALIITFFDISLALASFFGIGKLLEVIPLLEQVILIVGSLMVLAIGVSLLKAQDVTMPDVAATERFSYWKVVASAFAIAWLNPQAILDGTMLLGAFRVSMVGNAGNLFIGGVCTASVLWFTGLTFVTSLLKDRFQAKFLLLLNRVCGVIIIGYGLRLLWKFVAQFI
jgi:L-lysine exporter family protein LysE/ArgO